MKTYTIKYLGETRVKTNLTDAVTGAILPESTVTVLPPDKKLTYFDTDKDRKVDFVATFKPEKGGYFSHGVPEVLANILDKSPNYQILKSQAKNKSDDSEKVSVQVLEDFGIGRNKYSAGEIKSFKKVFAEKLISEGKVVAA